MNVRSNSLVSNRISERLIEHRLPFKFGHMTAVRHCALAQHGWSLKWPKYKTSGANGKK